jgi:two-component system KDP operon response regulator KdpE
MAAQLGTGGEAPLLLVVEDDQGIRDVMRIALESEGYRVCTAADGEEALRSIAEAPPALVVLDLGLPVVDGEALAAYIRTTYGRTVPIVVVSATSNAEARPWRLGARAYIQKPFELEELLSTIERVLAEPQV